MRGRHRLHQRSNVLPRNAQKAFCGENSLSVDPIPIDETNLDIDPIADSQNDTV